MKDKFVELGCDFINEAVCQELAEEEELDIGKIERQHFEEEDEV